MHREDCDALRAELEARREEIATLRGVVAALRVRAPAPARAKARLGTRATVLIVAAAVVALLLAKGWIAALLCR